MGDFEEFQILAERIEERMRSMRYEQELEHALCLGFTEVQLTDVRYVFDALDTDGSGQLALNEVRAALAMLKKQVPHDACENAFRSLDVDDSGELDFTEFLDFMQIL